MSTDTAAIFAIGVLALRAGLIVAGVIFCGFGFRLFDRAHPPSNAELSVGDSLKLNLVQVGPGVFFSLFGAALLVYCVYRGPTLDWSETPHQREVHVAGVSSSAVLATDPGVLLRTQLQIAFLNRIDPQTGQVAAQDRADIERLLRSTRLALMRGVWQPSWGEPASFEAWVHDPASGTPNPAARAIFERR